MMPGLSTDSRYGGFVPYVRAQYLKAYDANKQRIPEGINADVYGLKLGIDSKYGGFSIFGNYSPTHDDSFNDGQYLHPYSDLSGVNYTDTTNNSIEEFGPGWAAGTRIDYIPTDNIAMYARYVYYLARNGHYHDFYFTGGADNIIDEDSFVGDGVKNQDSDGVDVGFLVDLGQISPQLAGLKFGNELGVTIFDHAPTFYNNRLRFYYSF